MQNYLDLVSRYATPEDDFVWFDWGQDFAALVWPQEDDPRHLVIFQGGVAFPCDSFVEAINLIGEVVAWETELTCVSCA